MLIADYASCQVSVVLFPKNYENLLNQTKRFTKMVNRRLFEKFILPAFFRQIAKQICYFSQQKAMLHILYIALITVI